MNKKILLQIGIEYNENQEMNIILNERTELESRALNDILKQLIKKFDNELILDMIEIKK